MYKLKYFELINGRKPAREWINAQDKSVRVSIYGKKDDLSQEGLNLLGTNALLPIKGEDKGFYELRNVALNWRIGIYHDKRDDSFVFLYGWRHDQAHEKEHQREIEKARQYLHEYLKMER